MGKIKEGIQKIIDEYNTVYDDNLSYHTVELLGLISFGVIFLVFVTLLVYEILKF